MGSRINDDFFMITNFYLQWLDIWFIICRCQERYRQKISYFYSKIVNFMRYLLLLLTRPRQTSDKYDLRLVRTSSAKKISLGVTSPSAWPVLLTGSTGHFKLQYQNVFCNTFLSITRADVVCCTWRVFRYFRLTINNRGFISLAIERV